MKSTPAKSSVILGRRILVVAAIVFWQGGFSFYGAVVVPTMRSQLPAMQSAPITQRVTDILNFTGIGALAPLLWDMAATRDPSRSRRRSRWLLWAVMIICLGILFWMHYAMDEQIAAGIDKVAADMGFQNLHRWYLLVNTLQWAACVGFGVLALVAWRAEDQSPATHEMKQKPA